MRSWSMLDGNILSEAVFAICLQWIDYTSSFYWGEKLIGFIIIIVITLIVVQNSKR